MEYIAVREPVEETRKLIQTTRGTLKNTLTKIEERQGIKAFTSPESPSKIPENKSLIAKFHKNKANALKRGRSAVGFNSTYSIIIYRGFST
jgi:hypothetical protein